MPEPASTMTPRHGAPAFAAGVTARSGVCFGPHARAHNRSAAPLGVAAIIRRRQSCAPPDHVPQDQEPGIRTPAVGGSGGFLESPFELTSALQNMHISMEFCSSDFTRPAAPFLPFLPRVAPVRRLERTLQAPNLWGSKWWRGQGLRSVLWRRSRFRRHCECSFAAKRLPFGCRRSGCWGSSDGSMPRRIIAFEPTSRRSSHWGSSPTRRHRQAASGLFKARVNAS